MTNSDERDFILEAQEDFGAILHSLPVYWFGGICHAIVMLWPLALWDWLPSSILAHSGNYSHDARQYAAGLRAEARTLVSQYRGGKA